MKNLTILLAFLLSVQLLAHNDDDPVIGFQSSEISPEKAKKLGYSLPYGSRVDRLYPGTPAQVAGLQPLDYVYAVNGQTVSKQKGLSDLLEDFVPGDKVNIDFYRKGEALSRTLFLSRRGDLDMPHQPNSEDPFLGISQVHDELPEGVAGVPVSVVHNSTAQAMGLERGDIITAIDGNPVADWHDLSPMIDMRKVGDPIQVSVYRNGDIFTRSRPIKSQAATHGNHSRPNGPEIIQPQEVDLPPVARIELQPVTRQEATVLPISVADNPSNMSQTITIAPEAEIQEPVVRNLAIEALNIFPNPNTGIFDIQFELPQRGETAVYIYNPAGQAVYFNTLGEFTGTFSDRIDIANGVRGIYFLEIRQGPRSLTRKVVLQ
ncbi:PDZ domain-containing protein [Phaeodactylibacter xiamenensis]|uniref:PDZ domain-containing protein n=1 Tax=Phaeodactylibacter xiamenensis TaxID=1524460 RepID=UPI003BAD3333